ncbi:MAG TPA: DUF2281 domain-containing protein [Dyadobacter sp.]|jgi:hypothetical protein|nr:DUF2281 domain-containing protein [Dyadobacter sp.]
MSELEFLTKVSQLPPSLKEEVVDFIDFLIDKHDIKNLQKKKLKFGMMKGTFSMQEDFDAPLEDFKEYMP